MSGRIGTHARALGVAALVGAALLAGCTSDEGIEVVVDDGGDALATLNEAVARTQELSGEFTMVSQVDMSEQTAAMTEDVPEELRGEADLGDGRWSSELRGRFDGDDLDGVVTMTGDLGGVFGSERGDDEMLVLMVDGRAYRSVAPFDEPGIVEAMAGRTWIEEEMPDDEELAELEGFGPGEMVLSGGAMPTDVLGSLGDLEQLVDLREEGGVEFDGTELRSFRASFSQEALWPEDDLDEFGEELTGEQQARVDRIEAYRDEHVHSEVQVLVDDEGLVRRVEVTTTDDIEARYRDCMQMYGMGDSSMVTELRALGAPVEITAPDPSQVMPLDEYETVWERVISEDMAAEMEGMGASQEEIEAMLSDELEGLPDLDGLEGEERRWLEQGVIDGAPLIGLDPATVPSMTDDELYDAEMRIWEVEDQQPRTPTALGEMTRTELFWHVRQGMEREGIDPSMADGMTNEQLAGLIDAYMADPDLAAKVPEGYRVPSEVPVDDTFVVGEPGGEPELMDDDWLFEGCPE
jgi:hypothetical protein